MKRLKLLIILIPLIAAITGCKKEEVMPYNGKEGVYFSVRHGSAQLTDWPYQPFSNVEFARIAGDETEVSVNVAITGPVKDYDRTFQLEVNPDSTTATLGQHYDIPQKEWIVPAGALSTNVKVVLKRTPDLQETMVTLGLRLLPTKDFELSFPEWDAVPDLTDGIVVPEFDASLHTLRINDIMVKPEIWSGSMRSDNRETGPFGVFSRKKMEFMIDNLGVTYNDFASEETMPTPRILLISSDAAAILIKRFNEGNPVLDEDGRLMFLGSVPWMSYVGTPWVPGS